VLFSAFNQTTSSNKQKNEAWKKINQAVTAACPQELPKDAVLTKKKKYENIRREALHDIQLYRGSICGTGGGPMFHLKPL